MKKTKYPRYGVILLIIILLITLIPIIKNFAGKNSIKVGILDSGIEFPSNNDVKKSFVKKENGYLQDEEPYDIIGHETSILKILRSEIDDISIKIYSGRIVSTYGIITPKGILNGLKWLQSENVSIVMMSFGTPPLNSTELEGINSTISQMVIQGITVIAAAGNSGNKNFINYDCGQFPAILPQVIGVGALDRSDLYAPYSSFGISYTGSNAVDVVAEGINHNGSNIGTSFAVPRIAAIIIKILDYSNENGYKLSPMAIATILGASSKNNYNDRTGFGLPNYDNAIGLIEAKSFFVNFYLDEKDSINNFHVRFYNESFHFRLYFKYVFGNGNIKYKVSTDYNGLGDYTVSVSDHISPLSNYFEFEVSAQGGDTPEILSELKINLLLGDPYGKSFLHQTTHYFQYSFNSTFSYNYENTNFLRTQEFGSFHEMDSLLRNQGILPIYGFDKSSKYIYRPYTVRDEYDSIFSFVEKGGVYIESYTYIRYMGKTDSQLFKKFNIDLVDFGEVNVRAIVNRTNPLNAGLDTMYHEGIGFEYNQSDTIHNISYLLEDHNIKLALTISYGSGFIILLGSTGYLTNLGYYESGNQSIIVNLEDIF